ncbi:MAG TPA: cytochrome c, partial [Polyangiales bacterium]|nr:cytochrome c [Polyangiales bacterium]
DMSTPMDPNLPGAPVDAGASMSPPPPPPGSGVAFSSDAGMFLPPEPQPPSPCAFAVGNYDTQGQATALAWVSDTVLVVQQREPAGLAFFDVSSQEQVSIDFAQPSVADTGHTMFHARAGAGVACASCHAEGGDDAHVWTFAKIGPRRTQHLRGGILGTEPFHWNGDMKSFEQLMNEVFVGRMVGFSPTAEQRDALSHWIDKQPALHATPDDGLAVSRGQTLFESKDLGCTSCHAGSHLTNNATADVGTGAMLQVPSLRGVSFRAPFLHDGCAKTLRDRFGSCGGGDSHGHTSQLSDADLKDLVAYLESL